VEGSERVERNRVEEVESQCTGSLIAECVEREVAKLDLSLGILDGVYPTTQWNVGTLGRIAWVVSEQEIYTVQ